MWNFLLRISVIFFFHSIWFSFFLSFFFFSFFPINSNLSSMENLFLRIIFTGRVKRKIPVCFIFSTKIFAKAKSGIYCCYLGRYHFIIYLYKLYVKRNSRKKSKYPCNTFRLIDSTIKIKRTYYWSPPNSINNTSICTRRQSISSLAFK